MRLWSYHSKNCYVLLVFTLIIGSNLTFIYSKAWHLSLKYYILLPSKALKFMAWNAEHLEARKELISNSKMNFKIKKIYNTAHRYDHCLYKNPELLSSMLGLLVQKISSPLSLTKKEGSEHKSSHKEVQRQVKCLSQLPWPQDAHQN